MQFKSFFLLLLVALCSSCIVRSWNAFYFEKQTVNAAFVLGAWQNEEKGEDTEGQWVIEELNGPDRIDKGQQYRMSYFHEKQGLFTAHFHLSLFKVNEVLYADIQDMSFRDGNAIPYLPSPFALFGQVPLHIIAKVQKRATGGFDFLFLNEKAIGQKRIKYISRSINEGDKGDEIVLTASTKKLQRWMKKLDESLWDMEYSLRPIIETNTLD